MLLRDHPLMSYHGILAGYWLGCGGEVAMRILTRPERI